MRIDDTSISAIRAFSRGVSARMPGLGIET
jgi:hypothetical protein